MKLFTASSTMNSAGDTTTRTVLNDVDMVLAGHKIFGIINYVLYLILFLQKNNNPHFLKTVGFGDSNGLEPTTRVKVTVYHVKERMTGTVSELKHRDLGIKL